MNLFKFTAFLSLVVLTSTVSASEVAEVGSWSEIAVDDLHFIRATLRENHPGPVDAQNPWFGEWYARGFSEAMHRAEDAVSYAGYYFSIKYYMEGFQDGHLGALADELIDDEQLSFQWPGFLVEYGDGGFRVAPTVTNTDGLPPAGARLISCNGVDAKEYAEAWLQGYVGLSSVAGSRPDLAPYLLIDAGNPFIARPVLHIRSGRRAVAIGTALAQYCHD